MGIDEGKGTLARLEAEEFTERGRHSADKAVAAPPPLTSNAETQIQTAPPASPQRPHHLHQVPQQPRNPHEPSLSRSRRRKRNHRSGKRKAERQPTTTDTSRTGAHLRVGGHTSVMPTMTGERNAACRPRTTRTTPTISASSHTTGGVIACSPPSL